MKSSTVAKFIIFTLVLLLAVSQEGECRRKILKGRKAINRTNYRYSAFPAWATVLLVGLGEVTIGAILFAILKFGMLDRAIKPQRYIYLRKSTSPLRMSP